MHNFTKKSTIGRMRRLWLLFCQSVTIFAAAVLVLQLFRPVSTYSYNDILQHALPAVVGIYGSRNPASNASDNIGSGVIIDDGHILTNYHLVANMQAVRVDINGETFLADIVGVDPEIDIAILRVDAGELSPIIFAEGDIGQGDIVFAIGNPYGLLRSVSMGIVSAVGRKQLGISRHECFIQTDAAINPGSSGGALTNAAGELVGINSALYARHPSAYNRGVAQGIGFAVPSDIVRRSLTDFLPPHAPASNPLGAEVRPMSSRLHREVLDFIPDYSPVMLVSRVWRGTPAAAMGLLPGDIVLQVDGISAQHLAETGVLPISLRSIEILRGGERLQLNLPNLPKL